MLEKNEFSSEMEIYLDSRLYNFLKKNGYDPEKFEREVIYPHATLLLLKGYIKLEVDKNSVKIFPGMNDLELLLKKIFLEIRSITSYIV